MTIDMSNNRVPYRLLTEEEWAALREHKKAGGDLEYYCDGVWSKCGPSWSTEGIYRTVPLPKTQDVIAWDRLPDWAQWVARDATDEVHAYDDSDPHLKGKDDQWMTFAHYRRIDDFPGIVQIGTVDWRESKQRRPRG
jgi:hypothetical protein